MIELCHRWQTEPSPGGGLWQLGDNGNDVVLIDDRGPSRRRIELEGWQAAVYLACDRTQGIAELLRLDAMRGVTVRALADFINDCVADQTMLVRDRTALSLAVYTPARTAAGASAADRRLVLSVAGS